MSRPDASLDARDGHGSPTGDALDFASDNLASDKFGLSTVPSLFVFTTFRIRGMLNCLQLLLFYSYDGNDCSDHWNNPG
jgi:hypothetical protein